MNNQTIEQYERITEEFKQHNEMSANSSDLVEACKIGLKKLRLAKQFSKIDENLIEISMKKECVKDFFSGILTLEAKRLAFKEEALKCQDLKLQIKK